MTYKPLPKSLTIKPSTIEGLGLFATKDIKADTMLGLSHMIVGDEIFRTPVGAFVNHSEQSNCKRTRENLKWFLQTTKDIKTNEELTLTYTLYKPK
tara:strand:+ start:941 stop:1228 length:288 start_codon:yes stop_codon:yes gene_type:complete